MRTAATVQLAAVLLTMMVAVLHAQPIPLGIFYNLNHGGTGTSSGGGGGACTAANGQLDFSTSCNLVYYVTLLL